MLTSLLMCVLLQSQPVVPLPTPAEPADPPSPPPKTEFSEAFKRRRAWEKEQQQPSWKDHFAFAAAAYFAGGFFTDRTLPAPAGLGLSVDVEVGGHFTPAVSLVGLMEFKSAFPQAGHEVVTAGLGVGLRLGSRHYVTIGVGETVIWVLRTSSTQVTFAPIVELRGAILLTGRLGIHLRAGMSFGPTSVFADVGVGFGFSL